jgi:hypothetical protein
MNFRLFNDNLIFFLDFPTNNMLFTSKAVPYNTVTSSLFKDKGDTSGYPCAITDSNVITIPKHNNLTFEIFKAMLPTHIMATATRGLYEHSQFSNFLSFSSIQPFPRPLVGLSFQDNEAVKDDLTSMGFQQDTHSRTSYYKGTIQQGGEQGILTLHPNPSTWVPTGVCDLRGYQAYIISTKVLVGAASSIPYAAVLGAKTTPIPILIKKQGDSPLTMSASKVETIDVADYYTNEGRDKTLDLTEVSEVYPSLLGENHGSKAFVISADEIPNKNGLFFPYFHGLLTPDKDFVPNFILSRFTSLLGGSANEIAVCGTALKVGKYQMVCLHRGGLRQPIAVFKTLLTRTPLQVGRRSRRPLRV